MRYGYGEDIGGNVSIIDNLTTAGTVEDQVSASMDGTAAFVKNVKGQVSASIIGNVVIAGNVKEQVYANMDGAVTVVKNAKE